MNRLVNFAKLTVLSIRRRSPSGHCRGDDDRGRAPRIGVCFLTGDGCVKVVPMPLPPVTTSKLARRLGIVQPPLTIEPHPRVERTARLSVGNCA